MIMKTRSTVLSLSAKLSALALGGMMTIASITAHAGTGMSVGGMVYPMGHGLPFAQWRGLPITPISLMQQPVQSYQPAVVYSSTPPAVPNVYGHQPSISVGPVVIVR
jgi:hypothetical protein